MPSTTRRAQDATRKPPCIARQPHPLPRSINPLFAFISTNQTIQISLANFLTHLLRLPPARSPFQPLAPQFPKQLADATRSRKPAEAQHDPMFPRLLPFNRHPPKTVLHAPNQNGVEAGDRLTKFPPRFPSSSRWHPLPTIRSPHQSPTSPPPHSNLHPAEPQQSQLPRSNS